MAFSKKQLTEVKKRLENLRAEVCGTVKNVSLDLKTNENNKTFSQHPSDQGTDDFNQKISMQVSEKNQMILKSIDRALAKIEEGSYGVCDMTKKPIAQKRLEAVPYAVYTTEAQAMIEKGLEF